MMRWMYIGMIVTLVSNIYGQKVNDPDYDQLLQELLSHRVREVSVMEVQEKPSVIFLDARKKEEFNVSHIPNAVWIGYEEFHSKRLKNIAKDATLVVYCSVGYRSEVIASKLERLGYTNVNNLYGGIFEWINQKFPLVDQKNEPTTQIHPYDEDWGKWITYGQKKY